MINVAVIEDYEDLRELIVEHLLSNGVNAIGFEDAESCLESPFTPSLYILDINLPDMDGFEFIRRVRGVDLRATIIVLSARSRPVDQSKGYSLGADVYLNKPVDPEVLLAAVLRHGSRQIEKLEAIVEFSPITRCLVLSGRSVELTQSESDFLLKIALGGSEGLAYWAAADLMGIDLESDFQNTLEARVARLRKKLVSIGCDKTSILSMRGLGYRLGIQLRVE